MMNLWNSTRSAFIVLPSFVSVLVEQSGVLATLSRWRSRVQIPPGTLTARYANWKSNEAQNFVIVCGFDSHPCHLQATTSVGWALASPSGRNPPATGCAGSTPARRTDDGPFVYRFRTPASQAGRAGSIPARVTGKENYDQVV